MPGFIDVDALHEELADEKGKFESWAFRRVTAANDLKDQYIQNVQKHRGMILRIHPALQLCPTSPFPPSLPSRTLKSAPPWWLCDSERDIAAR